MKNKFSLQIFFVSFCIGQSSSNDCVTSLTQIRGNVPLYLTPSVLNENIATTFEPKQGDLVLSQKEHIVLACPSGKKDVNSDISQATCVGNGKVEYKGKRMNLKDISCPEGYPRPTAKIVGTCFQSGTKIKIGFQLQNEMFLEQMTICYNNQTKIPMYSEFNLSSSVCCCGLSHFKWLENGTFHINLPLSNIYDIATQKKTLNKMFGFVPNANTFINSPLKYFSRGLLIDSCDFSFPAQRKVTANYYNTVPLWSQFASGNWKILLSNIRNFLTMHAKKIGECIVYTGTHGIAKYRSVWGTAADLSLDMNRAGKKSVFIPEYIWKVIYDPYTSRATAFVLYNNPFTEEGLTFCPNICKKINWLTWDTRNKEKGFIYCCSYEDLRKRVQNIPKIFISELWV